MISKSTSFSFLRRPRHLPPLIFPSFSQHTLLKDNFLSNHSSLSINNINHHRSLHIGNDQPPHSLTPHRSKPRPVQRVSIPSTSQTHSTSLSTSLVIFTSQFATNSFKQPTCLRSSMRKSATLEETRLLMSIANFKATDASIWTFLADQSP